MQVTARSTPNIAIIKYWGNRNNALRLPSYDSLGMTINTPSVDITVEDADAFSLQSFLANGSEKIIDGENLARFTKHRELTNKYLNFLGIEKMIPGNIAITIRSAIPPSIGLASSAAVFSCIAKCYGNFGKSPLTDEQISVIARLGSGSATRSIFGGFTAIECSNRDTIDAAKAVQIANESHWPLYDIIIVPSQEEKAVGSTEGHAIAQTSPYWKKRVEAMPRRQSECIDAILNKDFEKLQAVAEEDCMDMHHVMETSSTPLKYLSDETHRILAEVKELRKEQHLEVLYTMDAGPTVHLFCTPDARTDILAFANAQQGCTVFETTVGPGTHLV